MAPPCRSALVTALVLTGALALAPSTKRSSPALKTWSNAAASAALAASIAFGGLVGAAPPAAAENELAAAHGSGFDSSLIDTGCFKADGACGAAARRCLETDNCRRGMTCTAKCLGDNACITGCFAKYGNAPMDDLLECSIEKNACIKVAILPPGPDTAATAPAPPLAPVRDLNRKTLEGTWYKVMGWNDRYDCFDCQRNSFRADGRGGLDVDVEFSMPRPGRNGEASAYPLRLSEKLVFDAKEAPMSNLEKKRHARTEGHMFGLTFWENWSVIGENAPGEPEFKFVHYSGRTSQNTYEGAFVYAREPSLPAGAKSSVYKIAKDAGWKPAEFCAVRNDRATCGAPEGERASFAYENEALIPPSSRGLFMGGAAAAEVDDAGLANDRQEASPLPKGLKTFLDEVASYAEDPHVTQRWVFSQQQKMGP